MAALPKLPHPGGDGSRFGAAISLGTNFTAGMLVFTFLGIQAGKRFGHPDAWTLAGLFLGLLYGGYEVWKIVRLTNQTEDPRDEQRGDET